MSMPVILPRLNPSGNVILGMKMDMYDRHARSVLTLCRSQCSVPFLSISLQYDPTVVSTMESAWGLANAK